jgi:MscS family membrane protein
VGFGAYSLDLEVFAYIATSDWNEFLQIREDIFLRMMDVVEESGTGFAFPSQTTYLSRDRGLDDERARKAEEEVEGWREESKLPFPSFDDARIAELDDTLDYPPRGSAVAKT